MHVLQFFNFLALAPDVEIIKTFHPIVVVDEIPDRVPHFRPVLPEVGISSMGTQHSVRESQLDGMNDTRWTSDERFRNQQMEMFRHYDIPDHYKSIPIPHLFENSEEQISFAR